LITRKAIAKLGWTLFPHPPYSTDNALSDFHIFGALGDTNRGKGLGVMTRLLKRCRRGCEYKINTDTRRE
jgi:hypothetical protein